MNGGHDYDNGHTVDGKPLMESIKIGYLSGYNLRLFLPEEDFFVYLIGDNYDMPVFREISRILYGNIWTIYDIHKLIIEI